MGANVNGAVSPEPPHPSLSAPLCQSKAWIQSGIYTVHGRRVWDMCFIQRDGEGLWPRLPHHQTGLIYINVDVNDMMNHWSEYQVLFLLPLCCGIILLGVTCTYHYLFLIAVLWNKPFILILLLSEGSYCIPSFLHLLVFFCVEEFWTFLDSVCASFCICLHFWADMLVLNPLDLHSCVFDCIINRTCSVWAFILGPDNCMFLCSPSQCVYHMCS